MFVVLFKNPDDLFEITGWREKYGYSVRWELAAACIFLSREAAEKWLADNRASLRPTEFEIKELT